MRSLRVVAALLVLLVAVPLCPGGEKKVASKKEAVLKEGPTFKEKHEQMLYTVVRVRTKRAAGSGTVVWSGVEKGKKVHHTYILTNHHVIAGAITVKKVWDAQAGRDIKKESRSTVIVEFFKYNNYSKNVGVHAVQADILTYDARGDMALLETREKESPANFVATLFPVSKLSEVKIYDELHAVGASLGHPPISTKGMLNFMDDEIDDLNYWMSSAQIIFGNSGGAMFRWSDIRRRYEWLGIPSRISMQGWSTPITHMGYFIPIPRVKAFLESNRYRFIISKNYTWAAEKKLRAKEKKLRKNRKPIPDDEEEEKTDNREYNYPGDSDDRRNQEMNPKTNHKQKGTPETTELLREVPEKKK